MSAENITHPAPPLYRSIAAQLMKNIDTGVWGPGDRIPTEAELAERFGASQGTVRLAILELVRAKVLYRQQGRGTFVNSLQLGNSIERFFRYERQGEARSTQMPKTTVLGMGLVAADEQIARAFNIKRGKSVGWLRRLRAFDEEPFLMHDSYFPVDIWESVQANCDFGQPDLYLQMQQLCGVAMLRADEYLAARLATEAEGEILQISPGAAVIQIERHAYTYSDLKVEFRRGVGRGDRFSYHVQL